MNLPTQPVVAVQDAYGNTVTCDTSTVTLAIASGPGSGVLALHGEPQGGRLGRRDLRGLPDHRDRCRRDLHGPGHGLGPRFDTSASFTITVGAAAKVAFTTQPVGGVAEGVNLPTQPAVTVQDAFGNRVTGNTSTVTLAIASGPGTGVLSCTGGLGKAAVAGISTFAGCQITGAAAAGTYTLTATDGALTPDTSASFTITVGAAAVVVFSTQPVGGVPEGTALPTQPGRDPRRLRQHGHERQLDHHAVDRERPRLRRALMHRRSREGRRRGRRDLHRLPDHGHRRRRHLHAGAASGALTPATSIELHHHGRRRHQARLHHAAGRRRPRGHEPLDPAARSASRTPTATRTADTSAVTLAIASGPGSGVLGCTVNPRTATAGLATFAGCQITGTAAAGTYTLLGDGDGPHAGDVVELHDHLRRGGQARVHDPAGGRRLAEHRAPDAAVVVVRDAYDNHVTSDTGTVTLAIASGPGGTLACTSTAPAASAGTAHLRRLPHPCRCRGLHPVCFAGGADRRRRPRASRSRPGRCRSPPRITRSTP